MLRIWKNQEKSYSEMPPETEKKTDKNGLDNLFVLDNQSAASFVSSIEASFKNSTTPEQKREDTRNSVTKQIITLYVLCVGLIIVVGLLLVSFGQASSMASLKTLVEFLNILVLPIITLVLGFYFGSEKK
jgi:hypothetical protein